MAEDHELSSVGFTIACGGLTAGLDLGVFLTSASLDLARKRAIDSTSTIWRIRAADQRIKSWRTYP